MHKLIRFENCHFACLHSIFYLIEKNKLLRLVLWHWKRQKKFSARWLFFSPPNFFLVFLFFSFFFNKCLLVHFAFDFIFLLSTFPPHSDLCLIISKLFSLLYFCLLDFYFILLHFFLFSLFFYFFNFLSIQFYYNLALTCLGIRCGTKCCWCPWMKFHWHTGNAHIHT